MLLAFAIDVEGEQHRPGPSLRSAVHREEPEDDDQGGAGALAGKEQRLRLRDVELGDVSTYVRMRCDPVMMAELGGRFLARASRRRLPAMSGRLRRARSGSR